MIMHVMQKSSLKIRHNLKSFIPITRQHIHRQKLDIILSNVQIVTDSAEMVLSSFSFFRVFD